MVIPFNNGCDPTLTVVNHATQLPHGYDLAGMLKAFEKCCATYFTPIYGFGYKAVELVDAQQAAKPEIDGDHWCAALVDHSEDADALGYHELTDAGKPQLIIAVLDTLGCGQTIEDCFAHEAFETLPDPGTNLWIAINDRVTKLIGAEVSDPVQGESLVVDGWAFASFVYPSWFQYWLPPSTPEKPLKFDATGACTRPLEILKGGYASFLVHGKCSDKFGSKRAEKQFGMRHHARAARRRGKRKSRSGI